MKKNILIVEDENAIVNLIQNRLDSNIYNIDIAIDGKEAIQKIVSNTYDLITLDIMIPFIDGFDVCKKIREKSKQTLVIMISALDTMEFKQKGYDLGIDDYIAKPFSAKELAIKIQSQLKRKEELKASKVELVSNIILNEESKDIIVNGYKIEFTPSEYLILSILILNKNRVYSRTELAQLIYDNYFGEIDEQGINSHIYNIREKVKTFYKKDIIKTIRGMGYKIYED
jgi:DNA-binding response OmpR family regulator